mmetsp:Transcript_36137/g.78022  ORF Transcript_36137/g.78022 Transcript_36137/m.78022 type:complete len:225 (+) Transcript_36137:248-922(+)
MQRIAKSFHGLSFYYWYRGRTYVLDLSHNKLQVLLPKVFDSLDLDRVYLQHNDLSQLHTETFRGLTLSKNGILDMSRYKLQDLPPKVFDGMRGLKILDLAENELRSLGDRLEQNQLAHLDGVEPGWQPPHNVTQRPLQRFHKSSKAAAAEQSAGETSAKAVSEFELVEVAELESKCTRRTASQSFWWTELVSDRLESQQAEHAECYAVRPGEPHYFGPAWKPPD